MVESSLEKLMVEVEARFDQNILFISLHFSKGT